MYLPLNFTFWNFRVEAHSYQFLEIMPIALTHKAAALFIAPNQQEPPLREMITTVAIIH